MMKSNALMNSGAVLDKKTLARNKSALEIAQTMDVFVEEDEDIPINPSYWDAVAHPEIR